MGWGDEGVGMWIRFWQKKLDPGLCTSNEEICYILLCEYFS